METLQGPRILLVGSGAVGAVFAEHLSRAGAEVGFLVRDPDSANARMPRTLHQLRPFRAPVRARQVLDTGNEVRGHWDQCWLCLPSTALGSDWLREELDKLPPSTAIINWAPNLIDRARLEHRLQRPVHLGLTGFVSYQAPLPKEHSPTEGIAYWLPPLGTAIEHSPQGQKAATLLNNGALPARCHHNLPGLAARLSATLVTLMAALELEQWSLRRLRRSKHLNSATGAAREANRIGADYLELPERTRLQLPHKPAYQLALRGLPSLAPINLERYLGYHFAKVSGQTRLMLDTWIQQGESRALAVKHLCRLRDGLG